MHVQHPNQTAMRDALERWKAEAATREDGVRKLRERGQWAERQLQRLSASTNQDIPLPDHLVGVTAWDLSALFLDLYAAADDLARHRATP